MVRATGSSADGGVAAILDPDVVLSAGEGQADLLAQEPLPSIAQEPVLSARAAGSASSAIETLGDDSSMTLYLREVAQVPLLTFEEEVALAKQREAGNLAASQLAAGDVDPAGRAQLEAAVQAGAAAEQRLIESNLRLVVSIARRHVNRGLSLLDLIQEGNIGLKRGVDGYNWRRGFRFSTYAYWWIRQAITRALAEQGRLIRLPVHVSEQLGAIHTAARKLQLELGREPTLEEIGAHVELEPRRIREILRAATTPLSIEAPVRGESGLCVGDLAADTHALPPSEEVERELLAEDLDQALRERLTPREVDVLQRRYGLGGTRQRTLAEIGEELGVSREWARQIEANAMRKLRRSTPILRLYHDYAS